MSSGPAFIDPLDHTDTELGALVRDAHASGVRVVMLLTLPMVALAPRGGIWVDGHGHHGSWKIHGCHVLACERCGREHPLQENCVACADEDGARPDPDDLPM